MALINCPECNQQVSSAAAACPNCAYPIAATATSQTQEKPQTIELTAKRYKLQQILAALLLASGMVAALGSPPESDSVISSLMMFAGLAWFVIVRILIWWHHR